MQRLENGNTLWPPSSAFEEGETQQKTERKKSRFRVTFQYRVVPVKVRSLGEVLSVQVQALSEAQQLSQLFDERAPAHARFPRLLQSQRERGHRGEVVLERSLEGGERGRAR